MTGRRGDRPSRRNRPGARGLAVLGAALALCGPWTVPTAAQEAPAYATASAGTRELDLASGTRIKLLLDAANLGDASLEMAEITFPVGTSPTRGHRHGATEILYVVEGVLEHVVNGEAHRLEPGMVGVVRPGDEVIHRVLSHTPVKTLVVWVPGGEADRLAPAERWKPVGGGGGPSSPR